MQESITFNKILEIFHDYEKNSGSPKQNIKGIFVVGSIILNKYISGWSDIDLIALVDKPTKSDFDYLENFNKKIIENTKINKSSIAILPYNLISQALKNPAMASRYMRYMQSFLKSYPNIKNRTIYIDKKAEIECLSIEQESLIDPTSSVIYSTNYYFNYLSKSENWNDKKTSLRRLIKVCLVLIQQINFLLEKKFFHDYDEALSYYINQKKIKPINIDHLMAMYNLRFKWDAVSNDNLSSQDVEKVWEIYLNLEEQYYAHFNNA
jgi:hypothetical protein